MIRVTASKAGLLPVCQYPFREGTPWQDTPGRAAIDGNTFHAAIAPEVDSTLKPYAGRRSKWVERRLEAALAWLAANPGEYRAEVAYALDVDTCKGRVLGQDIGRKYEEHGRGPRDVVGAADFVQVIGGVVYVYDWKTGRSVDDRVWAQMEALGLLAARAYGASSVVLRPLHVTECFVEDSMQRWLQAEDLDLAEASLRRNLAAIPDAWPVYGDHCSSLYCPARNGCGVYQLRTGKKEVA